MIFIEIFSKNLHQKIWHYMCMDVGCKQSEMKILLASIIRFEWYLQLLGIMCFVILSLKQQGLELGNGKNFYNVTRLIVFVMIAD